MVCNVKKMPLPLFLIYLFLQLRVAFLSHWNALDACGERGSVSPIDYFLPASTPLTHPFISFYFIKTSPALCHSYLQPSLPCITSAPTPSSPLRFTPSPLQIRHTFNPPSFPPPPSPLTSCFLLLRRPPLLDNTQTWMVPRSWCFLRFTQV